VRSLVLFVLVGCQPLDQPRSLPSLDEPYFRCRVQPILGRSCAAFACHGDGLRYFRVFARNRLRMTGKEGDRNAALSDAERAANFESARAMIDGDFLLRKPLASEVGGYFHRGAEIFGEGNVFADTNDPDYRTLAAWLSGAKEDPACIEPGSDQ